jgi:hypothetical protein
MDALFTAFANATATFLTEETVEGEDAYGDPIDQTDWAIVETDVAIRFETNHAAMQTDVLRLTSGGDVRIPDPLIYVPEPVAGICSEGDRVVVTYRDAVMQLRITSYDYHTASFDGESYAMAGLADWGDADNEYT